MFGLWERKGKSGELLPEAHDAPPFAPTVGFVPPLRQAIELRYNGPSAHNFPRWHGLTLAWGPFTKLSMHVRPASAADTVTKDSSL